MQQSRLRLVAHIRTFWDPACFNHLQHHLQLRLQLLLSGGAPALKFSVTKLYDCEGGMNLRRSSMKLSVVELRGGGGEGHLGGGGVLSEDAVCKVAKKKGGGNFWSSGANLN